MLILGADTSGKHGSIALVRCEGNTVDAIEIVPLQGGTFSAQLVPQIAALLEKHNFRKSDMDAFAVASGPGSFTGLRVGLAAIKALAEILQKPIAAVSLLQVIAFEAAVSAPRQQNRDATFLVALDAARREVFVGNYKVGAELPICMAESLFTLDELIESVGGSRQPLYTPDESIIENFCSRVADSPAAQVVRVVRPNAASVARLGYKKILARQTVSPEELDATYIRRADAEMKSTLRNPA